MSCGFSVEVIGSIVLLELLWFDGAELKVIFEVSVPVLEEVFQVEVLPEELVPVPVTETVLEAPDCVVLHDAFVPPDHTVVVFVVFVVV